MRTRETQAAGSEAAGPPSKARRRPGSFLRIFGILCLVAAVGVGGYLGWLLWGTGLTTKRHQDELRRAFEPKLVNPLPPPPAAGPVRLPGDAVAIIDIPRLDLDMVVVEGTDTESLKRGPGHYTETAYPWDDGGRVGIAGHRTTYGAPFWSLDKMRPGDPIILETEYGTYTYRVTRVLVLPADVAGRVLQQTERPTLVLTTCTPRFSASERLIVIAVRP